MPNDLMARWRAWRLQRLNERIVATEAFVEVWDDVLKICELSNEYLLRVHNCRARHKATLAKLRCRRARLTGSARYPVGDHIDA